jgi:hypothetical protein
VNAATAGGTVLVCPGTYPEQITINKNLTVKGVTAGNATGARIVPPTTGMTQTVPTLVIGGFLTPIAPQVLVQTAKSVNFANLTVDGANDGIASCAPYLVGILFQNASGTLSYMSVVNQILGPTLTGCQGGLGILVQSGGGLKSVVDVADSVVQNFAKNGITGTEVGTKLTIERTHVIGIGLTPLVAQNGVEFGFGSTGSISDSSVADVSYVDPESAASVGILLVGSPNVTVKNNVVTNTDTGVYALSEGLDGSGSNSIVTNNEISSTHTWDGIALCSNNNTVTGNVIHTSDEAGVWIGGSCTEPTGTASGKSNKIKNNEINRACAGVMYSSGATPATNTNSGNTFTNVDNISLTADSCPAAINVFSALAVGSGVEGDSKPRSTTPVR